MTRSLVCMTGVLKTAFIFMFYFPFFTHFALPDERSRGLCRPWLGRMLWSSVCTGFFEVSSRAEEDCITRMHIRSRVTICFAFVFSSMDVCFYYLLFSFKFF